MNELDQLLNESILLLILGSSSVALGKLSICEKWSFLLCTSKKTDQKNKVKIIEVFESLITYALKWLPIFELCRSVGKNLSMTEINTLYHGKYSKNFCSLVTTHQEVTHLFLMEHVLFLHNSFRCNLKPQSTSRIITFSFPPISLLSCARLCGYHQLVCAACREIVVSAIMPPKKKAANEPSKKTDQKKKEKIIEVFESLIIFSDNTARLLSTYICDLCPL